MIDHPLVSVVIPTRNRKEMLMRCLSSVYESDYAPIEVIVFDDSSDNETEDAVKRNFPDVRLLRSEKRVLMSASRNIGARASKGQYIFFVDDDNVIDWRCISILVEAMQTSDRVGVAAPAMYYYSEPQKIWWAGSKMSRITSLTFFMYKGQTTIPKLPYLSQAFHNAWLMDRVMIDKVGLFDKKAFPFFLSEFDYSERMLKFGFNVLVAPTAKVWHDVLVSDKRFFGPPSAMHIRNPMRAYFVARNRILFMRSHRGVSEFLVFFFIFEPIITAMQVLSILVSHSNDKSQLLRGYFRGLIDAVCKWL